MNAAIKVVGVIYSSLIGGIGNSIAVESRRKNYDTLLKVDCVYMGIVSILSSALLCLYQPFMKIWMGNTMLFSSSEMIVFCIYFYISNFGATMALFLTAAGKWWEYRVFCISEMVFNVVLNYFLVKRCGAIGAAISTCLSFAVISIPGSIYCMKKNYFNFSVREYIVGLVRNMFITIACCSASAFLTSLLQVNGIMGLFLRGMISVGISTLIWWLFMRKTYIYSFTKSWILNNVIKREKDDADYELSIENREKL